MSKLLLTVAALAGLSACATLPGQQAPVVQTEPTSVGRMPADVEKIGTPEQQLAEKHRQCLVDKRRLEVALKDSQKQAEDLQKKLDVLLAIDRELRSKKNR